VALENPATRAARLKETRFYVGGALVTTLAVALAELVAHGQRQHEVPLWLTLTGISILWLLLVIHSEWCTERHQYHAFLRRYPWTSYCAWFGAYRGPDPAPGADNDRYVHVYLFDVHTGEPLSSLVTARTLVPWASTSMTVWLSGDPATGGVLAAPGGGGRLALAMPDAAQLVEKIDRLPLISLL
jgi:hypothetical protein